MVLAPPVMLGASIVVGEPEVADVKGFAIGALASHGLVALSLVVAPAYLVVVLCVEHDVAASPGRDMAVGPGRALRMLTRASGRARAGMTIVVAAAFTAVSTTSPAITSAIFSMISVTGSLLFLNVYKRGDRARRFEGRVCRSLSFRCLVTARPELQGSLLPFVGFDC